MSNFYQDLADGSLAHRFSGAVVALYGFVALANIVETYLL